MKRSGEHYSWELGGLSPFRFLPDQPESLAQSIRARMESEGSPVTPRRIAKTAAEAIIGSPLVRRLLISRLSGRAVILAYHNVIPDTEDVTGDASLHLRESDFREQIDIVLENAEVVPLSSILDAEPPTARGPFRVALTFDDAYVGSLRVAASILTDRELPATIFVPTGLLGTDAFWWDSFHRSKGFNRHACLNEFRGEPRLVEQWASQEGVRPLVQAASQRPASTRQLERFRGSRLISFGHHTNCHPNLTMLDQLEVESEFREARERLEGTGLPVVNWLAYPYGLTSPGVESMARDFGYDAGLRVSGGLLPSSGIDRFQLPRVPIPAGVTGRNFLLRLFGILTR